MFGRDPDKTATAAAQFGFDHSTTMDAAFEDQSFLVDICLPIPLHAEYVLRALDAGKETPWSSCRWPATWPMRSGSFRPPSAATSRCSWTCSSGSSRPTRPWSTPSAPAPTGDSSS
jgi:hypothetical protein